PLGPADLRQLCEEFPVILALPCPAGQLEELLARIRPAAIGLRGGEEEKVGYKSFDELDELFELLAIEV
ncbi:MAG: N-(5'-phosphoribosyl)anthranilate isomerase, partial [Saprospiraceae bacterium]|nr:N-(5'-phosphoribosyl)anthranilate isomerase [Saprospiraceae bacterium]MCB0622729.1 N-(5'-phosphoribosyl)anthranilate isomerase [Saprospiraceae bacterium]